MTKNRKKKQSIREYATASGLTYSRARSVLAVTRPGLSELRFTPETTAAIKRLLDVPRGIIVVAGPMGSGKTTVAHALAAAEPGLVVVDEVRDEATAQAMFAAAADGKKVVATVHATSAVAGMMRVEHLAGEAADHQDRWGMFSGTISVRFVRDHNGRRIPAAGTDNRYTGEYRDLGEELDRIVAANADAHARAQLNRDNAVGRITVGADVPAMELGELGFTESSLEAIRSVLAEPTGVVVVVGRTGSGKSTLLAASAAARPDAVIYDDVGDQATLERALAEAAAGQKVIVSLYGRGPVDAKQTLAQLGAPIGELTPEAMINAIVAVRLVPTVDRQRLVPVVGVARSRTDRPALRDLSELLEAGVIDRDVSITHYFRPLSKRS